MKKSTVILLGILFSLNISAGPGIVRGKIIDKKTGEELIGATIYLEGTTIGTITDFDGNYSLDGLDEGSHNIVCSYISYETSKVADVKVVTDEVTILNFQLGSVSVGLEEVIVKAKVINRTENALLIMQKKSATVIDGISAQQISRMGDSNAASSLKRVTGISVQDGKYVYVRGLSDRYSKTLLNGAEIPGLDPNRNTVQMDLFPGNLLENMVVYKSFSPNLPGDFTGGLVNIITKDFPEKYTFQFSTSIGFNPQANLNSDFLSYEGGKLDWLGIDDGTRDNPVKTSDIPYYPFEKDKLDEVTGSYNKIMMPEKKYSFIDQSHSIYVGNQYKLFGKSLGFIAGLSYSKKFNYYKNGEKGSYKQNGPESLSLNNLHKLEDTKGEEEVLIGAMANTSLKISNTDKIGLTIVRNQSGTSSARYLYGSKNTDEVGMFMETRTLQYLQRAFTSAQLRGEHHLEKFNKMEVNWLSSFILSQQDEPDLRFFTNSYFPNESGSSAYAIEPSKYKLPARYYRDMYEYNFDNRVDVIYPFELLGAKSKLQSGLSFLYKHRRFNDSRVDYWFQFSSNVYNDNIPDFLSDENIGQSAIFEYNRYGIYVQNGTDIKNSYTGNQSVVAGYLLTDMPVFEKVRVVVGARVEGTSVLVESDDTDKEKGELSNLDILPALNLNYSANSNMNIRFAYSRTLARPSFRELAPFASEDFAGGETRIGNPNLRRTLIDNIDLRWEMFMKPGEIISLSSFYKNFSDPIEVVDNIVAVNTELTWKNVDEATVYGVEAEFRKNLDFISLLRNFKFGMNLTLVQSNVSIDSLEMSTFKESAPKTRVMSGQSPYIFNTILSYKNDSLGFYANVGYNVSGEKLVVVVKGATPDIYEQPRPQLDFTMSKKFGKNVTLKFSAKNLLNQDFLEVYNTSEQENIYRKYSTGRKFSLGFSYLIK